MDTRSPLRKALNVWRARDLLAQGLTYKRIAALTERGTLIARGQGWYTTPATPPGVSGPLSRGNRATCITAAEHHGLWVPSTEAVHEVGRRSAARLPGQVETRHRPFLRSWPDEDPIMPLRLALAHAISCLSAESVAVLAESALDRKLLDSSDVEEILEAAPAHRHRAIGRIGGGAQSGTETRVRRYLERRGVRVRRQVEIPGVGRVDLLVGERLILECDSEEHHTSRSAYHDDRGRDAAALRAGYVVLRLTWQQVWLHWEDTQELLDNLVRGRVHRGRRF